MTDNSDMLKAQLLMSCMMYIKSHPERTNRVLGRDKWFKMDEKDFSGLDIVQEILFAFQRGEGCVLPDNVPIYGHLFKGKSVEDLNDAIVKHVHELTGSKPRIETEDEVTKIYYS